MSLPWVEKYRPSSLDKIISHNEITSTLKNLIDSSRVPHMIFYGPSGTGKTTTILACAREIYGSDVNSMVLELNGSDDRGINVVREQIKEFSSTNNFLAQCNKLKLVILDEADSMTYDAQFALRRVIENNTTNTRFCFVCNYITKIIPGIQSRCIIFKFSPISHTQHIDHIKMICRDEHVNITEQCIHEIVKISEGDMRRSINLLQALHLANNENADNIIDINELYNTTGHPSPVVKEGIINTVINNDIYNGYTKLLSIKQENNLCVNDILKELTEYVLQLNISNIKMSKLLIQMAKIETYLANNVNDDIQLGGIVACIKQHL